MKTRLAALAVLILTAGTASAAPAKKKDKAAAPAAADDAAPDDGDASAKPAAADGRKRVEAYLAKRTKELQDAYAARMDFSEKERLQWEDFWGKERDARKTFELRLARQAVDLFSTLETLDPAAHDSTVADFEKLRGTMVKSFEAQQRRQMQEYFSSREARWRKFADEQEKARADFAAEADASWKSDKEFLKAAYAPTVPPLPGSKR